MKRIIYYLLLIGIGLLLNTCSKDEMDEIEIVIEESFEEAIPHEALTDEQEAFWDNQESITLGAEDIMLPNGLTVAKFELIDGSRKSAAATSENPIHLRNRLIQKMAKEAIYLTTRSNFIHPAEDYGAPAQRGLAYVFGSRDHTVRKTPHLRKDGTGCHENIYGLDCSGFVYRLFLKAGIDLNTEAGTWADLQRRPDIVMNAIKKGYPEYADYFKVEDLGKIDPKEFRSGDIIYWLTWDEKKKIWRATHIGMVLKKKDGKLAVAQSNGKAYEGCVLNYTSVKKGPRFCTLEWSIKPKAEKGFGDNYGIVRIRDKETLDFNKCYFEIKVQGQYYYFTSTTNYTTDADITLGAVSDGSFDGNTFWGYYTESVGPNYKITGDIKAILNDSRDTIVSFDWSEEGVQQVLGYKVNKALNVLDIPLDHFGSEMVYWLTGKVVIEHIEIIKDEQTSTDGLNYYIKNYRTRDDSHIMVRFYTENP